MGYTHLLVKKFGHIAIVTFNRADQHSLTMITDDLKEGIAAFFEKREGNFKGN